MTHRYHDFGKYLVCVDQSLSSAVKSLIINYQENALVSLGLTPSMARNALKAVIRAKLPSKLEHSVRSLPVFGQVGIRVHHGFKVFDFGRGTVTKVFEPGFPKESAEREIAACREASRLKHSPNFMFADSESNWFREEFLPGTHATSLVSAQSSDYLRYYDDVEACLLELLSATPAQDVKATDHIEQLSSTNFREAWLAADISEDVIDEIDGYIGMLKSSLVDSLNSAKLQLVRTHGDFSLVNTIVSESGVRFIDWEGIGQGSLYSDLYNFMFVEEYYGRSSAAFENEMGTLLERYRVAVLDRFPALESAATIDQRVARRLYYLERISLMVQRDVTENLQQVVQKSIALFNEFDQCVGDSSVA